VTISEPAKFHCDTKWHRGQKVEANFLVLPPRDVKTVFPDGVATCERHLLKVLRVMLTHHKFVTMRRVNIPSTTSRG
jgi:hypothetical protein